ncbi:MAG TPA: cell division protein FtsL, partial [Gammaproteobacteria bacterium]|nr:cell division protein FtsL [Gammaproteobacteria bacterium]MCH78540.1 cell division protein FtsL [Gammaproteobacteria bacterium]
MPERIGHALVATLLLAVFASALGVIHLKHHERSLIAQLSRLRHEHDRLDSEWSRLLLEEATLTT